MCASCETTFEVGSTRSELRVDVCNSCHPFFTGKQMILDTAGQVERFQRRLERTAARLAASSGPPSRARLVPA